MRRGERKRFGPAVAASALAHVAVVALVWATASRAAPLPQMRVYAVDIVSPPPQAEGEFNPEPGAPPEPVEAEPEPETPEPEPEPTPPDPEPLPAPPTKKTPEPAKPKPTPTREEPKPAPPKESKPVEKPAAPRPSTGRNPDPKSAGGEGLDYQLKGVQCPSPEYCNNIIRQVNRYFRSPGGTGEADVYFVIRRDGSVSDIRLVSSTGGAAFRLAVMEAVEQAGLNEAFGALPRSFPGDDLPVSFYFRPAR